MKIFRILIGERKSLVRDPMSLFLTFIPFLIFSMVKFGLPVLSVFLKPWVDLYSYYGFIMLMVYLMTPMLLGMVLGLLLIDERDLDVLTYISVTPFSLNGYLLLKALTGTIIALMFNILIAIMLKAEFDMKLVLTLILASMLVPYFALAIFVFSKNKVEALTKGKLISFTIFGTVIPYFTNSKLVYLLVFLPTFWIERLFFANSISSVLISFSIGTVINIISIVFFMKRIRI